MSAQGLPVDVVIVTWNSAGYIEDCLASLRSLRRPPARIVVVDNASRDGTPGRVRAGFPEVELIECERNVGFCGANNAGIAATSSPYVLVLNPDTRLEADFLEHLLPAFDDPAVGIACGKLLRFDAVTLDSAGQLLSRSRHTVDRGYGKPDDARFDRDATVFGACGAAALYRRSMIDSVADEGGAFFDPRFFAFHEDLDVAWRAAKLGWIARYRHRAVGYHARGGSAGPARGPARRFAMLRRSDDVRFHIVKNRWLSMLRNDRVALLLRDLPFILARDAALFGLLALTSPGVLLRLWRERSLFRDALRLRRLDTSRSRHNT